MNAPAGGIEAWLRQAAQGAGPRVEQLLDGRAEGAAWIMQLAQPPEDWTRADTAAEVLRQLEILAEDLRNENWRSAAQAALRIPRQRYSDDSYDTLAARLRERARSDPRWSDRSPKNAFDAYRTYWASAARLLAEKLEERIRQLNRDGWPRRAADTEPEAPLLTLPISFLSTDVLYEFDGYVGVQSTSHRYLVAHGDVDHYEAVGWYYSEPDAPVEIVAVANCILDGPLEDLPQGGRCGRLRFDRTLRNGDPPYYFAYTTKFNSQKKCRPTILYEVRGQGMAQLTVRAQFSRDVLPVKCWRFDVAVQAEGAQVPPDDSPDLLKVSKNGYVEAQFKDCKRGRKYGMRWIWPPETTRPSGGESPMGEG